MAKRKSKPVPADRAGKAAQVASPPKSPSSWLLPALAVAFLACLVYANTLGHQYCLDDFSLIKDNFVTKKGWEGIPTHLTKDYRYGYWISRPDTYRPLSLVMFALEWELFPDQPFIGHLLNVLLFGLSVLLLYLLIFRLQGDRNTQLALITCTLFAVLPVHTEVVANIKSRDEILALLGFLGAALSWVHFARGRNPVWLLIALFSYAVAMFSKESAITLLPVFPLMLLYFPQGKSGQPYAWSSLFLLPVAAYLLMRQQVVGNLEGANTVSVLDNVLALAKGSSERLGTACSLLWQYARALAFPWPLVSDKGYPQVGIQTLGGLPALSALLLVALSCFLAVRGLLRRSAWSFGLVFFLLTFSISSNLFITIGTSYGERLLYAPSLGFAWLLACGILALGKVGVQTEMLPYEDWFRKFPIVAGATVALATAFAVTTWSRNPAWHDSYTLYHTDVAISSRSAKLNYHHGLELAKKGIEAQGEEAKSWNEKAIESFRKAISLHPDYHDAYGQLGLAYYRKGEKDQALAEYERSVALKPHNPIVYSNMGIIYFEKGNLEKAREVYEIAVQQDPRYVDALRNLGVVYAIRKDFPTAISWFEKALEYAPEDKVILSYLGNAWKDAGNPERSAEYFRRAGALE